MLAVQGAGYVIAPVFKRMGFGYWHLICSEVGADKKAAMKFQKMFGSDELVPY